MPRKNQPGSRTITTYDLNKPKFFEQLKAEGGIPERFNSFEDILKELAPYHEQWEADVEAGLIPKNKRKPNWVKDKLGITAKGLSGNSIISWGKDSKGNPRAENARVLRESFKPDEIDYLRAQFGEDFVTDLAELKNQEWGDKKKLDEDKIQAIWKRLADKVDPQATRYSLALNAKEQADAIRDQVYARYGVNYTPSKTYNVSGTFREMPALQGMIDRGHVVAALEGAGFSLTNLLPEWAVTNRGHSSAPRLPGNVSEAMGAGTPKPSSLPEGWNPKGMRANATTGDMYGFFESILEAQGLGMEPPMHPGLVMAADRFQREPVQGNLKEIKLPAEGSGGLDPQRIVAMNRRLWELEQQGVDPNEINKFAWKEAGFLDMDDGSFAKGGPVTTVAEGVKSPTVGRAPESVTTAVIPEGIGSSNRGGLSFRKAKVRRMPMLGKQLPGILGAAVTGASALGYMAQGGSPVEAAQQVGLDMLLGDIDGGAVADGTLDANLNWEADLKRQQEEAAEFYRNAASTVIQGVSAAMPGLAPMVNTANQTTKAVTGKDFGEWTQEALKVANPPRSQSKSKGTRTRPNNSAAPVGATNQGFSNTANRMKARRKR